jgi:hypothetical protein
MVTLPSAPWPVSRMQSWFVDTEPAITETLQADDETDEQHNEHHREQPAQPGHW